MTPVRTPAIVRGDVPGLLRRGMPVRFLRSERAWHGPTGVVTEVFDGAVTALVTSHGGEADGNGEVRTRGIAIDFTDPAAVYLSLHWLADRGHPDCLWMLPATHGGRVAEWDGLTAWEVSAIVVSVSVGRVARGVRPIIEVYEHWRTQSHNHYRYGVAGISMIAVMPSEGWMLMRFGQPPPFKGPETGDAGKLAADTAALSDGCCLQVPGGLVVPV